MTNRERWIIYPLLFLALGTALRDKLTRSISEVDLIVGKNLQMDLAQGIIHCRGIEIVDEAGQAKIIATSERYGNNDEGGTLGTIRTVGPDGRPLCQLDERVVCREMRVVGANNLPRVIVGGTTVKRPGGGQMGAGAITIEGFNGQPVIAMETDPAGESGIIRTGRVNGKGEVMLSSSRGGGVVSVVDRDRILEITLGHLNSAISGLVVKNAEGKVVPLVPAIQRLKPLPEVGRPPEPAGE